MIKNTKIQKIFLEHSFPTQSKKNTEIWKIFLEHKYIYISNTQSSKIQKFGKYFLNTSMKIHFRQMFFFLLLQISLLKKDIRQTLN